MESERPATDRAGTIGIIGAGHIGQALARTVLRAGREVVIANSRGPESLAPVVADLGGRTSSETLIKGAARSLRSAPASPSGFVAYFESGESPSLSPAVYNLRDGGTSAMTDNDWTFGGSWPYEPHWCETAEAGRSDKPDRFSPISIEGLWRDRDRKRPSPEWSYVNS